MAPDIDPNAPTLRDPASSTGTSTGPSLAGRKIGEYRILRELGRGGMGVVYLAHDETLQRDVAIKVLQPKLASDPEYEKRFIREARTSAKLEHPNVVPVYTAGRDGELLYMAMSLVKGRTLDALLKERGRLPAAEAVDIIRQAARGLGAAHKIELVHRDIKPHNIMIDAEGRVKVMDFGLMRSWRGGEAITESGVFYGTPEFASPEQCDGGELDGRADLYSLGAVFYELLTGHRPHVGNTPLALFKKILEEPPTAVRKLNPDVPPEIAAVVEKMMAKRREDRFASAEEVVAALDGRAPAAAPPRRTALWALAAGALLIVAGALFRRPAPAAVEPKPGRTRLVVFDLKNGIPKPESAWYSIALSDLLIAALSKRPALDVPPRDTLLWTLKQRELAGQASEADRRVLTGELGARAYLSGSYYAQRGRIRLTLAGYKLPENSPLFPEISVERAEDDLFALIDQAAAELAKALLGEAPPEPPALAARSLENQGAATLAEENRADLKQQTDAAPRREKDSLRGDRDEAKAIAGAAPPSPPATAKPQEALKHLEKAAAELPRTRWTHAWYENRKALEGCGLKKDEFEAAAAALSREFRKKSPGEGGWDKAAANDRTNAASPAEASAKAGPRIEFVCPGCDAVRPGFERCDPCDRFMVVRLKSR